MSENCAGELTGEPDEAVRQIAPETEISSLTVWFVVCVGLLAVGCRLLLVRCQMPITRRAAPALGGTNFWGMLARRGCPSHWAPVITWGNLGAPSKIPDHGHPGAFSCHCRPVMGPDLG